MDNMIAGLVTAFAGPVLTSLGAKLGLPEDLLKKAMPAIIGLVLAMVVRKAKQPEGVQQVNDMFSQASTSMGGSNLEDFIGGLDPSKSEKMLTSLAGSSSIDNIASNISSKVGIPAESISALLGTMAPAVLGQAGAMAKESGLSSDQLLTGLTEQVGNMDNLGAIDYLLDNTPGISDDISRGFKKLFGG